MKKKNKLKVFPIFKHIFSQNNSDSITKSNLLLKRVIKYYPPILESLNEKHLEKEITQILSLIEKKWKKDENKEMIFDLLFIEFSNLINPKDPKNSILFLKRFLNLIKKDIKKLPLKSKNKISQSLKTLLKAYLKKIGLLTQKKKKRKKTHQKIITKILKNPTLSPEQKKPIMIKDNQIPKLDLGLAKGNFSNLLASRSTRRAQVSWTLRKNEISKIPMSMNNLNSIANSLGKSFISGEVVWFLRFFREKLVDKFEEGNLEFDLKKKHDSEIFFSESEKSKSQFYTSILGSLKLKTIFNNKDEAFFENNLYNEKHRRISKNDYSSHQNFKEKNLKKNYSNIYNLSNLKQDEIDFDYNDNFLEIFLILKDYIKDELSIIREILYIKLFHLKKKNISDLIIKFIFDDKNYLKKLNNTWMFNLNDIKKIQKCIEINSLLIKNKFKILNEMGNSILQSRKEILSKRGPFFKKTQFLFIKFLLLFIKKNPEHYYYFSNILLKDKNILCLLEHEIRNMLLKDHDRNLINIFFKFLITLINKKIKYKAILEYFSTALNVKRNNLIESDDDRILGILLRKKIKNLLKGKIDKDLFKLLRIIKNLIYFCTDGLLRCYYLRIVYISFLKIYSSFSYFYKKSEYKVMNKLLSIILVIIFDKKNVDISGILRQLKIITFMGKEVDLEFEINFKKILVESEKESMIDLNSGRNQIPKLNLGIQIPNLNIKNIPNLNLENEIPKLNLAGDKKNKNLFNLNLDGLETGIKNNSNEEDYKKQRKLRKIYFDEKLHKKMVEILLCLLLSNCTYSLEEEFTGIYPIQAGKLNYLYILQKHFLHEANKNFVLKMISELEKRISKLIFREKNSKNLEPYNEKLKKIIKNSNFAEELKLKKNSIINSSSFDKENNFKIEKRSKKEINIFKGILRLLKLLGLKSNNKYIIKSILGVGAYSTVYECSLKNYKKNFAIKIIESDKSIYERNACYFLFNEISILENMKNSSKTSESLNLLKIYDYGITENNDFFILFPKLEKIKNTKKNTIKTLSIFYKICQSLKKIHNLNIIHYDIKADNIMLNKKGPIIVDFGESIQNEQNFRIRGTECIKAPEMLLSGLEKYEFDQIQGVTKYKDMVNLYNRQSKFNISSSCDVWSLGCLLYELYTGEYLFNDSDWTNVFNKITREEFFIFGEEFREKLDGNVFLIEICRFILNRNPQHRPGVESICKKLKAVFRILNYDIRNENFEDLKFCEDTGFEEFHGEEQDFGESVGKEFFLAENFGVLKGFWFYDFLGVFWDVLDVKIDCEVYFIENEKVLEELFFCFVNDFANEKLFIDFYYVLQKEFFKLLKILKVSLKKNKQLIIFTESGIIGIIFTILIFQLKKKELINLSDVIEIQNKSINSFKITKLFFNFIIKICKKNNKLFSKFINLKILTCNCGNQSFLILKDEALKKRICECSNKMKNYNDWDCNFKFCTEYKSFLEKRFKIKIDDLIWYHLPIKNVLGLGSQDYSRIFDSDFNDFFKIWNKNQFLFKLDKNLDFNSIFCKSCSFLTMIINNKDDTVMFLEHFLQVFDKNTFFFN